MIFKIIKANFIANKSVLIWMTALFFMIFFVSFLLEEIIIPNIFYSLLIVNTLLQTEDRYGIDKLYCSLPIKRSTIVFSRYLSVLYALLISLTLSLIISILLINKINIHIEQIFYFIIPVVIFFSLILPFYFIFGYIKGSIICIISFLFTSVLLSWILNYFFQLDNLYYSKLKLPFIINLVLIAISKVKNYFGLQSFILLACVFTSIVLILSMSISIKLYKVKNN